MTEKKDDQEFVKDIIRTLDVSADRMELRTQAKVLQIRRLAVEAASAKPSRLPLLPRWVKIGAVAAAMIAVALVMVRYPAPFSGGQQSKIEELEIVATGEPVDFIEELEFYKWLEKVPNG